MSDVAGVFVLVGRILFGGYFAFVAGYRTHVKAGKMLEGFARSVNFPLAALAGWPTGVWLILGGLSVALGVWPEIGALMIAGFLAVAMIGFHRYWEVEDPTQKQTQEILFWRNVFGIGACLIFFGVFVTLDEGLRYALTGSLLDF